MKSNFPAINSELNSEVLEFFYKRTKMSKKTSYTVKSAQLYNKVGNSFLVKIFFEKRPYPLSNQRTHMILEISIAKLRSLKLNKLLNGN